MAHCPSSPNSPRLKGSKAIGGQEGGRISALPDFILVEILSLIDTKTAVQTSVLSSTYQGNALPVFHAAYLPCLEDAYVDLYLVHTRMALDAIKMLEQLREAKSVTLSLRTLEVLSMNPESLKSHPSPFHKSKHLKVAESRECSPIYLPLSVISYLGQVQKWQHSSC